MYPRFLVIRFVSRLEKTQTLYISRVLKQFMSEVIEFASSTSPNHIDIRYFYSKVVAYESTVNLTIHHYFYNRNCDDWENAKEYLQSIGFFDVKIIGYGAMKRMQLCIAEEPKNPDIENLNRDVPPKFLIIMEAIK